MFYPQHLVLLLLLLLPSAIRTGLASANRALLEGRVEDAGTELGRWLEAHPADPDAHLLLCRVFYSQELPDAAIQHCEASTDATPSSEAEMWLGRAYGMKASAANPLSAFSLARKVRDHFERAEHLDPRNLDALSDLGEFYVAAPAIVGGGSGKARDLAARLQTLHQPSPDTLSHRILGLLAEKENDEGTAEAEFRRATASGSPASWVDLAAFYSRHHRPADAESAVRTANSLDKARGAVLVDAASVLSEAGRAPDLAANLLREYLSSPGRSDAAPAFKVHLQLGRLLAGAGDSAGARREFLQAVAMAPDFPPARKAAASPEATH